MTEQKMIQVSEIIVEDRAREDYGDIDELKQSIKENGIIEPVVVENREQNYRLIAGGRRIKAAKAVDIEEVPAIIHDRLTRKDRKTLELSENLHRKDLTWQEEVKMKKELNKLQVEKYGEKGGSNQYKEGDGWSKADTARMLAESKMNTSRDIQIAEAIEKFPELQECDTKHNAQKTLKKMAENADKERRRQEIEQKERESPEGKKKQQLIDSFIMGDFFKNVGDIPDNTIDICEVDWPYGIDFQNTRKTDTKHGELNANLDEYNEVEQESYPDFVQNVLTECYRILKPGGWIILWFAWDHFELVSTIMKSVGFKGNNIPGLWTKNNGQTRQPKYYLASAHEPFFYGRKGKSVIENQGRTNVFKSSKIPRSRKIHDSERPIDLIEDILGTFGSAGDKVCVPFLGGGNTLLAANNLYMDGFGFELSDKYKNGYTVRVEDGELHNFKIKD